MIDYQTIRRASIYLRGVLAGLLEKQASDHYSFQYDSQYLHSSQPIPIACAFPLRAEPYPSKHLHPFFDNLILEGWLLSYAEKVFHIDKKNRFGLLMVTGRSTIGAVSIHEYPQEIGIEPEKTTSTRLETIEFPHQNGCCPSCLLPSPKSKVLHQRCAAELFGTHRKLKIELDAEQPLETFSKTVYGGSISGAQRKGLFSLKPESGVIYPDPLGSQYILKPDGDHPELPANEHLTMAIARKIGFKAPAFSLIRIPDFGFVYLTRRMDRLGGTSRRMEDMAQILGELSEDKYESSHEKVAQAIRQHASAPLLDLNDYFRRLIYCFLIANADMHLKNWSLLEKVALNGEMDLSPCYDLLNTRLVIPSERLDIGLTFLGKKRNLQRSYFTQFAQDVLKLNPKFIEKTFDAIPSWLGTIETLCARSYLSEKLKKQYIKIARERFETLY